MSSKPQSFDLFGRDSKKMLHELVEHVRYIRTKVDQLTQGESKFMAESQATSQEVLQAIRDLTAGQIDEETRMNSIITLLQANPNDPNMVQALQEARELKARQAGYSGPAQPASTATPPTQVNAPPPAVQPTAQPSQTPSQTPSQAQPDQQSSARNVGTPPPKS